MESIAATDLRANDLFFFAVTVGMAVFASLVVVFVAFFFWFRREQRRWQKKMMQMVAQSGHDPDDLFLTGGDPVACGELIAQFKVNSGKQVVSLLESDGKRFIHVDGELSPNERSKMVRYLKSEGFMS